MDRDGRTTEENRGTEPAKICKGARMFPNPEESVPPRSLEAAKYSRSTFQGLIAPRRMLEAARTGVVLAAEGRRVRKVAPLQVLLQFCGSEQRTRNGGQLNLNIQLCDV